MHALADLSFSFEVVCSTILCTKYNTVSSFGSRVFPESDTGIGYELMSCGMIVHAVHKLCYGIHASLCTLGSAMARMIQCTNSQSFELTKFEKPTVVSHRQAMNKGLCLTALE